MADPLTIGIVACSAEGAALCYRTICTRAPATMGPHRHPEIVLHSHSLARYTEALERRDLRSVGDLMLESAAKCDAAGADFLICPDNTIHAAMPYVREASPLPWLHIAEVVAAEARRRGVRKAAILGTTWLVESDVYPIALGHQGIAYLRPEPKDRSELGRIIMDELVYDIRNEQSVDTLLNVISRAKVAGCDAAILGCTELPIVISGDNADLPTLDSTRLLAEAALRHALAMTEDGKLFAAT